MLNYKNKNQGNKFQGGENDTVWRGGVSVIDDDFLAGFVVSRPVTDDGLVVMRKTSYNR